ncbi:MAG: ABC transporter permease [Thermoplasmata archaeon]|nr:ABC transporter permease [Thermoplasmata archaeon]MCK5396615.1 ABC transporter permease [Thermoplasmata archaeon]
MSIRARLSMKLNRRIFATILGVAFCVTYLAGTIAMVGGLHDTTEKLASSFDQGPVLVYSDEDFAQSQIDGNLMPLDNTTFVAFTFANVTFMDYHDRTIENVYVVSIYDPMDILGLNMTNESSNSQTIMGDGLRKELNNLDFSINLFNITHPRISEYRLFYENTSVKIFLNSYYSDWSMFPDDWLIIPREKMDQIRPKMTGNYSFMMITDSEVPLEEQPCYTDEVETRHTSGVVGFFERGIYQVEQDLWGIILMSGLITALLVYCIIAIETEYYAPTIKILRGMGADRNFVIQIFIYKALFITFAGGILGVAMGFCAASAISSISSLLGVASFISPTADFNSVVLPVIITLISGLIGGFWPAIRASKMFITKRRPA